MKDGIPVPIAPNLMPPPMTASVSSSGMSGSFRRGKNDCGGEATRLDVGDAETEEEVAEGDVLAVIVGVFGISRELFGTTLEYGGREKE